MKLKKLSITGNHILDTYHSPTKLRQLDSLQPSQSYCTVDLSLTHSLCVVPILYSSLYKYSQLQESESQLIVSGIR